VQIKDYTVYIKNLKFKLEELNTELDFLIKHIKNVFVAEEIQFNNQPFFELNYPFINDEKLRLIITRKKLINRKNNLNSKYKKINENEIKKKDRIKLSIEKLDKLLLKNKEEIDSVQKNELSIISDFYLTFFNQISAIQFYELYNLNYFSRAFYLCCNRKRIEHL
jgi:hypothetical protein